MDTDIEIAGITCDSRRVAEGWMFVCIRGSAADGHCFAADAAKAGRRYRRRGGYRIFPAAYRAFNPSGVGKICANWFGNPPRVQTRRDYRHERKTSTTYMLKTLLDACGYRVGLVGTIQNMIGERVLPASHTTPDPYELHSLFALMVAEGCTHAVMEVSSHALEQDRVAGINFDSAVFTNLTQDHLDYHKTMENYLESKKKLFRQSGCAIVNLDDQWTPRLIEGLSCPIISYSAYKDEADYTATNIRPRPDGLDFELVGTGAIGRIRLPIPGMFSVYNALAAAAGALSLGVPFDEVTRAFSHVRGIKGRAEIVPTGRGFTVVIDYAHTPDGLEKICKTLKECSRGRLVTLFGCGGDRDRAKRPLMGRIAAEISDFVIVTSDNPRTENPGAIIEDILKGIPEKPRTRLLKTGWRRYAGRLKTRSPATQSCLPARGMKPTRFWPTAQSIWTSGKLWRTRSINCQNRIEPGGVFIWRPRI